MTEALASVLVAVPVALGFYAYVGYPLVLWALSKAAPQRPSGAVSGVKPDVPMVSIVVPAFNEEAQIRGALDALLLQDYPEDRRQILVVSDASTDHTDEIVEEYEARGVELLRMPKRSGKTAAENASCAKLKGQIVINTDSSIRLHPLAVRALVSRMADPTVGVASGRDVSVAQTASSNATEAGYVGYEMWVRALETRTGGIVGASGSGYAIRTELHKIPIREDLSRDFSAALTARSHGFRSVSVDEALCAVPRTASLRREYRRKVRTIARGMETLRNQRRMLNPAQYGAFAWKLASHKVCRWLLPATSMLGVAGLAILAPTHTWALGLLAFGLATGLVAWLGWVWPANKPMPRVVSLPAFGVAANVAVLHALWRVAKGHQDHIWEPTRRPASRVAGG